MNPADATSGALLPGFAKPVLSDVEGLVPGYGFGAETVMSP